MDLANDDDELGRKVLDNFNTLIWELSQLFVYILVLVLGFQVYYRFPIIGKKSLDTLIHLTNRLKKYMEIKIRVKFQIGPLCMG